jgi:hypothetical protein
MRLFILVATFFLYLITPPAHAAYITIQALDLGSWFIPNNSGVYTITINTDGTSSHSPELTKVKGPTKGIYDIGDLPVSTTILSIDVAQNTPMTFGGSTFTLGSFQTSTNAPATDGAGRVTLTLGLTASTSGNGTPYPDGTYSGLVDVTINF